MKFNFLSRNKQVPKNETEETYKRLYADAEMEIEKLNDERKSAISQGLIINGDMYLSDDGKIKINEKFIIKPLMTLYDIRNSLTDILTDESVRVLESNEVDNLILKTIDDNGFSVEFELCLYDNRLEKIRMNILATSLIDLAYTDCYKFNLKLEHTLEYLEKFTRKDFIKRDRIIFSAGMLTIFPNERESNVSVLINYN